MKKYILPFLFLLNSFFAAAQDFSNLTFGTDNSLEVITWNIERFPKNGSTTIDYVADIIEALDADIIALQEISSVSSFNTLVNNLNGFSGYVDQDGRGLGYIYKTSSLQINDIYEIFTTSQFWRYFPRSPMVMDLNFNGQQFYIINNHYKCCGDGTLNLSNTNDEETRRYYANLLLKEYIENNLADKNVILLGDLNDNLTDNLLNNVFQDFLNDSSNYLFADMIIAEGDSSNWSFPSWPSHLDHILITNELFDEFSNQSSEIETIRIDDYLSGGWDMYDSNISDHRPVALKLHFDNTLSTSGIKTQPLYFKNSPNPFNIETTFTFKSDVIPNKIEIYNLNGRKIESLSIPAGESSVTFSSKKFSSGVYFAKLLSNKQELAIQKIVILK